MQHSFEPDYRYVVQAARNIRPARMPLYEHIIAPEIMERVMNERFAALYDGDEADQREFFRHYCAFWKAMGYDTVSFECIISSAMPGSGSLYSHSAPAIQNRADFEAYPWDEIERIFFERYAPKYALLQEALPEGMKAIGGPGNGVFECVQDVVGYESLCLLSYDDPELYADLFKRCGEVFVRIWQRFLAQPYADAYCVHRFGDDLGFRTNTLIAPDEIRAHLIPTYKQVIDAVHAAGKPFLLHCCGAIFPVMEDLIAAGIDAKHSNEDQIAPFSTWVNDYGDRIGNFGGIDLNLLYFADRAAIREAVASVIRGSVDRGGFALGSGNSIPDYIPVEGYLAMIEAANEFRATQI